MANLYIFQALYGPKPSVPTSDKAIESSNDISTAGPSNATASLETVTATLENVTASLEKATASPVNDTVSVVNTASNTEAVIPAPLHPERQQLIKTEEPTDEEMEDSKPWVPTGSNVLPLGVKDEPERKSPPIASPEAVPSLPIQPMIRTTPPNSFTGPPSDTRHILEYPPESYLPPPGQYYDQCHLPAIFGNLFSKKNSCRGCGAEQHVANKWTLCRRKCISCGTQRHIDEARDTIRPCPRLRSVLTAVQSCPLFYCSIGWYKGRNIRFVPSNGHRQIRPTPKDMVTLVHMGMIEDVVTQDYTIVPNMQHPLVQAFYRDKPTPVAAVARIVTKKGKWMPMVNSAHAITSAASQLQPLHLHSPLPQIHKQPPTTLHGTSASYHVVNSSLDPRLQSRSSIPPAAVAPTFPVLTSPYTVQMNTINKDAGDETKIQELEEAVLRLRMESIVKDREIRRLRAENEELRGNSYQTGSKRPCL